jgi:hypothetical protein
MKNTNTFIRVNGRGNAWPVFLGNSSRFYDSASSEDLSNASYSLINSSSNILNKAKVNWEVLIDAGNHTVPFLIKNGNRIPEAIVLTHGHLDHTLGLDWLVQSYYYKNEGKKLYPVYASLLVWKFVVQTYPHLEKKIQHKELLYGNTINIEEVEGLRITAFPVFHGEQAKGASMLFFQTQDDKAVLFTGDMLCPLLRKKDYQLIQQAKAVFIDSNNRFPYPASNHGSIVKTDSDGVNTSVLLSDWSCKISIEKLLIPHVRLDANMIIRNYIEEFKRDFNTVEDLTFTVLDFIKISGIKNACLIHFGGMEDKKYYTSVELSTRELQEWVKGEAEKLQLTDTRFIVPKVGDLFTI